MPSSAWATRLCVGIDEYGFGALNGCVNDALRIPPLRASRVLQSKFGVPSCCFSKTAFVIYRPMDENDSA
jgi:hypothetical protein